MVVGHPLDELEGTTPDGLLIQVSRDFGRDNAECYEAIDEVGLRGCQVHPDRVFVDDLVAVDIGHAHREDGFFVGDALVRILDVAGFDLLAGVVFDALAQVKNVRLRIGVIPLLGEVRHIREVIAVAHERIEDIQPDDVAIDEGLVEVGIGGFDVVGGGDSDLSQVGVRAGVGVTCRGC